MYLFLLEMLLGKNNVTYSTETVKQCVAIGKGNKFSHKFYRYSLFPGKIFCILLCVEKTLVNCNRI